MLLRVFVLNQDVDQGKGAQQRLFFVWSKYLFQVLHPHFLNLFTSIIEHLFL
jgi:hypothetical protein